VSIRTGEEASPGALAFVLARDKSARCGFSSKGTARNFSPSVCGVSRIPREGP
jgi:hypothetical protein